MNWPVNTVFWFQIPVSVVSSNSRVADLIPASSPSPGNPRVLPCNRLILPSGYTSGTAYTGPVHTFRTSGSGIDFHDGSSAISSPAQYVTHSRCLPVLVWSLGIGRPLLPRLPSLAKSKVPVNNPPRLRSPVRNPRSKISIPGLSSSRPFWDYPIGTGFSSLTSPASVVSSCHRCQRYLLNASPRSANSLIWSIVTTY